MPKTGNKRSLTIARHRTSISLEEPFWKALGEIAKEKGKSVAGLVREIDEARAGRSERTNLSASIRLYVLAEANRR